MGEHTSPASFFFFSGQTCPGSPSSPRDVAPHFPTLGTIVSVYHTIDKCRHSAVAFTTSPRPRHVGLAQNQRGKSQTCSFPYSAKSKPETALHFLRVFFPCVVEGSGLFRRALGGALFSCYCSRAASSGPSSSSKSLSLLHFLFGLPVALSRQEHCDFVTHSPPACWPPRLSAHSWCEPRSASSSAHCPMLSPSPPGSSWSSS